MGTNFCGTRRELEKVTDNMKQWCGIKGRGIMGSGKDDIKEVTILGRTVIWTAEGLEYEADAGHRKKVMEAEGLEEESNAVPSPAVKEDGGREELDEKDLGAGSTEGFEAWERR